ncbi:MAG: hypothetical protein ACHQ50_01755 [Fimbriimonadales bacterium]
MYARIRTLPSGSFVAGGSPPNDWSTQFDDSSADPSQLRSQIGEIQLGSTTCGVCADYAFVSANPFDAKVWIEASVGAPTQIHVNGAIQEITAGGLVTISAIAGLNLVRYIRSSGPIWVSLSSGRLYGSSQSRWTSLYPAGRDPFTSAPAGGPFINSGPASPAQ